MNKVKKKRTLDIDLKYRERKYGEMDGDVEEVNKEGSSWRM